MLLYTTSPSPFGRKVRMVVHALGIGDEIEQRFLDPSDMQAIVLQYNPLQKVPVLLLNDGSALYDSRVIVEYLDHRSGGGIVIPLDPQARFRSLNEQSRADGLLDAALLCVYEHRFRREAQHDVKWLKLQNAKIAATLDYFVAALPPCEPSIGAIALASALGYLDLRFEGRWRTDHRELEEWLAGFSDRFAFFATTAHVETIVSAS